MGSGTGTFTPLDPETRSGMNLYRNRHGFWRDFLTLSSESVFCYLYETRGLQSGLSPETVRRKKKVGL
jgi:hypothetical protein